MRFLKRKYPLVRQYDQIDCGPASLLSVLKYYGGDSNIVQIREMCDVNTHGTTIFEIVNVARQLGFEATGATGEYEDLVDEKMPCIAHVILENGFNHFVVIYKIDANSVFIGDPGKGKYKLSKEEFLNIWKRKAVILLKPVKNLFKNTKTTWLSWITGYIKQQETWILQTMFLGIVYTFIGLLTAIFIQWLVDRFIPQKDFMKIIYTGILLLFLLVIRASAGYFRLKFLVLLNKRINISINSDFLSHIFRIPKKFFDTRKIGDITARIGDSIKIQQAILLVTNTTIIDGLVVIGSFTLMFLITPVLAWVSMIIVLIYSFFLFAKTEILKQEQNELMKEHAKVESSYIDSLKGIDTIIGFNVYKSFTMFNREMFKTFQEKIEKLGLTQAGLSFFAELSGAILTVSILTIGAGYVIKDKLMLGQILASYSLLANILPAINRLVGANISLQGAIIAAQRLRDILLVEKEKNSGELPFIMKNSLTISKGAFSWPRNQRLFNELTITLEKGKIVSMWGKSGTGKSTLVQILQRKYYLIDGEISIDNTPAEKIDLEEYRKAVAVVPQQIKIFNGTVIENITVGRKITSYDDVKKRIISLKLDPFVSRFRQGLFTMLGEDGRKLSGGETQMLALMRALYEYPEVLIIDEGFSGMDIEIANKILSVLKNYAEKHAVFIITHNLRTILKTDYVYLLQDGKIYEEGTPKNLMSRGTSYFSTLINLSR